MRLSDWSKNVGAKRQIFVSGEMRGNEFIGPSAVLYFIETTCSLYYNAEPLQRERMRTMLASTEYILVPLVNAVGYHYLERDERLSDAAQYRMAQVFKRPTR